MGAGISTYNGSTFRAIALYNPHPDVYKALPHSVKGKHIMHVNYTFQKKTQSIDVYLHSGASLEGLTVNKKLVVNSNDFVNNNEKEILDQHNITIEEVNYLQGSNIEKEILNIIAQDVKMYCRNTATKQTGSKINYVNNIVPVTKIQYNKKDHLLTVGKAEFVDACLLEANLDFVVNKGACAAEFIPGKNDFQGFTPGDRSVARYDKEKQQFIGYYEDITSKCEYCYAGHHHMKSYPKAFLKIDQDQLYDELMNGTFTDYHDKPYGKKVNILRLGKRTETGAVFHRDQLLMTLETAIKADTCVVMPTKFLEYDKDMVDLLKRSNTTILYSITDREDMDYGPQFHGFDNEWRMEQGRLYAQAGLDIWTFLMADTVSDHTLKKNMELIDRAKSKGLKVQLLGIRIPTKSIAKKVTGRNWEDMVGKYRLDSAEDLFEFSNPKELGGYVMNGNGSIASERVHPEIEKMVGHNHGDVRMCFHNDKVTYCGSCGINKGFKTPTVDVDIERVSKKPRTKKKVPDLFTGSIEKEQEEKIISDNNQDDI